MENHGTLIILETGDYHVTGHLRLPKDGYRSRLTDYLNSPEQRFLPLTDAEVAPLDDSLPPQRYAFLLLAIAEIVMARPADSDQQS